eukprot:226786_1
MSKTPEPTSSSKPFKFKQKKHKKPSPPPMSKTPEPTSSSKPFKFKQTNHQKAKTTTITALIDSGTPISPSDASSRKTPRNAPYDDIQFDDPMDFEPFRAPSPPPMSKTPEPTSSSKPFKFKQ